MILLGAHMSIAGGVDKAIERGEQLSFRTEGRDCDCGGEKWNQKYTFP